MRPVLTLLHRHILMNRQMALIPPKMQKCWMKFAPCPYIVFFAPKIDWHFEKLGRMCCIPDKTAKKNAQALIHSFRMHALRSLGTTLVEGCVHVDEHIRLSALKGWPSDCRWTILISPIFSRLHSMWYCPKENSTSNDLQTFWNSKITTGIRTRAPRRRHDMGTAAALSIRLYCRALHRNRGFCAFR